MKVPELPSELYPYDYKDINDVLNVLSRQIGNAYREGLFQGYDDIDMAYMAFLMECHLSEKQIQKSFQLVFKSTYDEKRTRMMYDRAKNKIDSGEVLRGTGTFIQKLREMNLKEIENFTRQLQRATGKDNPPSQFHNTYIDNKTVKLKIATLKDIFSYPDPSYLIQSLIVENALIILSSYAGIGKSILSLIIAYTVITGKKLFDIYDVNKQGVVLIVDENPGSFLKERLRKIGFHEGMPIYYLHFQKVKIDNKDCFNQLIEIVKEKKPILVIFDALIRIHSARENEATEMSLIMENLRSIVNLGTTVIVLHHHRKGTGDKKEAVRGSSDILGGIDVHLALEEKDDFLILSSPKTRVKPIEPMRLKLEVTEDSISFKYIGKELNQTHTIINEIVEILKDGTPLGVEEIFELLRQSDFKVGINKLRDILKSASGKELIENVEDRGKKLYSLNPTFTASQHIYKLKNCETEQNVDKGSIKSKEDTEKPTLIKKLQELQPAWEKAQPFF